MHSPNAHTAQRITALSNCLVAGGIGAAAVHVKWIGAAKSETVEHFTESLGTSQLAALLFPSLPLPPSPCFSLAVAPLLR